MGPQAVVKDMALDYLQDSWQSRLLNYEGAAIIATPQSAKLPLQVLISMNFLSFIFKYFQFCHHTLLSLYGV